MNQKIGTSSVDILWACTPALFKEIENISLAYVSDEKQN
jgi:hypothetical protein